MSKLDELLKGLDRKLAIAKRFDGMNDSFSMTYDQYDLLRAALMEREGMRELGEWAKAVGLEPMNCEVPCAELPSCGCATRIQKITDILLAAATAK